MKTKSPHPNNFCVKFVLFWVLQFKGWNKIINDYHKININTSLLEGQRTFEWDMEKIATEK